MIRKCSNTEIQAITAIINDGAEAYRGVIPEDCFHEPYMPSEKLASEMDAGVVFWGWYEAELLVGVMGLQKVRDVTLIRHAYVRTAYQGRGIGSKLLNFLLGKVVGDIFVGTWAAASWAIRLYERHGFVMTGTVEKDHLLDTYWNISERQRETSVVLKQRILVA
jgi:GNAT superfamily N-acetyltransferase